tara:strand:- start:342 stop:1184 length:843 start_codon:yes stop_codon:yes gene_type:complete
VKGEWINNLCLGMIERLLALFFFHPFLNWVLHLYSEPFFRLESNFNTFVIALILVDFSWYWFHFLAHKWNLLWFIHKAHHAPQKMNLSVAFVNHPIGTFLRGFIYCAIAQIGVPLELVLMAVYVKAFYQYFQHTELWNRIPVLDKILVMPSHHRIHHAANKDILDKNFGGIFIIWDKIFGTYLKNYDGIHYGLHQEKMPLSVTASLLGGYRPRLFFHIFPKFIKAEISVNWVLFLFTIFLISFSAFVYIPQVKTMAGIITVIVILILASWNMMSNKETIH